MNVRTIAQTIRASACIGLTVLLLCMGLVMGNIQPAFASNEAADAGQNQVEKGLDKVADAGVAKQVEGRAKADAGGSMSPLQANHAIEVSTAMRQDLWHVVFSPLCP
jgi:hypothetical protein